MSIAGTHWSGTWSDTNGGMSTQITMTIGNTTATINAIENGEPEALKFAYAPMDGEPGTYQISQYGSGQISIGVFSTSQNDTVISGSCGDDSSMSKMFNLTLVSG